MMGRIVKGLRMVWASCRMAFEAPKLLIPSLCLAAINFGFITFILFLLWQRFLSRTAWSIPGTADLLQLLGLLLAWATIHHLFLATSVVLVYRYLTSGKGSLRVGEAFAKASSCLGPLAALAALRLLLGALLAKMKERESRLLLRILGEVLEEALTIASHLTVPALVLEGRSLQQATARAVQLARADLIGVAAGEVGLDLITAMGNTLLWLFIGPALIILLFQGYAQLQQGLLQGLESLNPFSIWLKPLILGAVYGGIAFVLWPALMAYARAAYYASFYAWTIREERAKAEGALGDGPPTPLAWALGLADSPVSSEQMKREEKGRTVSLREQYETCGDLAKQGRFQEAAKSYEDFARANAESPLALKALAAAAEIHQVHLGDRRRAEELLIEALERSQNDPAWAEYLQERRAALHPDRPSR